MGTCKATVFLVLAALALSNALRFVPADKELLFDYQAIVKAGNHQPTSFASQFVLHGTVRLQGTDNASFVKMTDLKYKMYNGRMNHYDEFEAKSMPLPAELADMEKTFKVFYDTEGRVWGISTEKDEKEYTINMKKSIASIFQLEDKKVVEDLERPRAFMNKEKTIYGVGYMQYNIIPRSDVVIVHKMMVMPSNNQLPKFDIAPTPASFCDPKFEDPITRDSQRRYILKREGDKMTVKHIDAHGGIYYTPFKGKSEAQYVFVNQTFDLKEITPIKEKLAVAAEQFTHDLRYQSPIFEDLETIPDLTLGRNKRDQDKMVSDAMTMMKEIFEYIQKDHIHTNKPDIKQGQAINRLQDLMKMMNLKALTDLHTKVLTQKEHTKTIFHQMLPLVGTKASSMMIKDLITSGKVDKTAAIEMLQSMAVHMKTPSRELLTKLEDMLTWDDKQPWEVRKTAMYTFATIVSKSRMYELEKLRIQRVDEEMSVPEGTDKLLDAERERENERERDIKPETEEKIEKSYEKYVTQVMTMLKSAKTYEQKMVYLYALSNMNLKSAFDHLVPIIRGIDEPEHHHRLMAMWSAFSVAEEHPEKLYDLLWPIMSNRHEHLELRIAAYFMIMELLPSEPTMTNMYWFMLHERNPELYHFHWTYMNSLRQRKDPCYAQMRLLASKLMAYMGLPSHGVSSYNVMDYKDAKYNWAMGLHSMFVRTNDSIILNGAVSSEIFNKYHDDMVINIKIHGLPNTDWFALNTEDKDKLFFIGGQMQDILKDGFNMKDLQIEIVVLKHGHIMNTWYMDAKNGLDMANSPFFKWIKEGTSMEKKMIQINYERYIKMLMSTDMGMLAMFELVIPVVHATRCNVHKEMANQIFNLNVDNRHKTWIHGRHGLSVFNPIVNTWQGISKLHSYDAVAPIFMDMSVNMAQKSFKISFKRHQDEKEDVWGLRSHAESRVFAQQLGKNYLEESSPKCKPYTTVSEGEKFRHEYNLVDRDCLLTGRRMEITAYDSEKRVSNGTIGKVMASMAQPFTKNFKNPLEHLMLSYLNLHHAIFMLPRQGARGYMIRAVPNKDVSNVDLTFRLTGEVRPKEGFVFTPAMKLNMRMTYSLMNAQKNLKTWDVNTNIEMNAGHTKNDMKMFITRIVPGQKDYKICIDATKKYESEKVTGLLNVAMSQSTDGKCVKDDTVIDVTMNGEKSLEQVEGGHVYESCRYTIPYSIEHYHTMKCLLDHSSLRKYTFDVKTKNIPTEFKKQIAHAWDLMKAINMPLYNWDDEHTETIAENNAKIEMVFPMSADVADIQIWTPQRWYAFTELPMRYYKWFGMIPDYMQYSRMFRLLHKMNMMDHCTVTPRNYEVNWLTKVDKTMPKEWTLFLGDNEKDTKQGLFIKAIDDTKMAVKVVDNGKTMEIMPEGRIPKVTFDGKTWNNQEIRHSEDWVSWFTINRDFNHPIVVMLPRSGIHFEFDGEKVQIVVPPVSTKMVGVCMHH